ncbi:MAG: adenosylhomocysteinase [Candidatus Doudnabacteria bacterium]|nr:adenosylhomocysteinase [Candidatus Doudnabacteria bacterium]
MKYDVKNLKIAESGDRRVKWASREMPVLQKIAEDFAKRKPLKKVVLGACLHVTAETANLMLALKAGGAKVALCASNPLSTQDDVAAALVGIYKIPVFARRGENRKIYYEHLNAVLDSKPNITMDDGADLVSLLHSTREKLAKGIWGSSEETTTGVIRLKSLARSGKLKFPVIALNDAKTKHMFDNRYGTGQSTIDGIIRATNILLAGKKFVIAGYGWCGRGLANRARGMGAEVIITEVDPVKALEARMDGFAVMTMETAAQIGDIFVTATGDINVIDIPDFERMKDGAVLANTGHFDVEINVRGLEKMAKEKIPVRPNLVQYVINKDKSIYLLAEGRLVNLAAAEGHPAAVMDMSFAGQAKAAEFIAKNHAKLKRQAYTLPEEIDNEIATLKLAAMGIEIDELTAEQKKYLGSWEIGT